MPPRRLRPDRQQAAACAAAAAAIGAALALWLCVRSPAAPPLRCAPAAPGSVLLQGSGIASDQRLYGAPDTVAVVAAPAYRGGCSLAFRVAAAGADVEPTQRAEVSRTPISWRAGDDVWYGVAFMLARPHPWPPPGGWMLVDQFFAQDIARGVSGGSPPLAIEISPAGMIAVDVRGGVKPDAASPAPRDDWYAVAPATPGRWHVLLLHVRWGSASDGEVTVWHRLGAAAFPRAPQVHAVGPNVLTVDGEELPVYAEAGIYRSRATDAQTLYVGRLGAFASGRAAQRFLAR